MSELKEEPCMPVLVTQEAIGVKGLFVRTSNRAEQDVNTQKIAPLWQGFMQRSDVQSNTCSPIYGCYFDYESDVNGEFNVLLGLMEEQVEPTNLELTKLNLEAGEYLRFRAKGEMPEVVIKLWGEVWQYFNDKNCSYSRRYLTDYECYTATDGVDIYIGVNRKLVV